MRLPRAIAGYERDRGKLGRPHVDGGCGRSWGSCRKVRYGETVVLSGVVPKKPSMGRGGDSMVGSTWTASVGSNAKDFVNNLLVPSPYRERRGGGVESLSHVLEPQSEETTSLAVGRVSGWGVDRETCGFRSARRAARRSATATGMRDRRFP